MINDPHAIRTESDDVLASVMRAMGLLDDGLRPSGDLIDQVLDVMKGLGIQGSASPSAGAATRATATSTRS